MALHDQLIPMRLIEQLFQLAAQPLIFRGQVSRHWKNFRAVHKTIDRRRYAASAEAEPPSTSGRPRYSLECELQFKRLADTQRSTFVTDKHRIHSESDAAIDRVVGTVGA